MSTGPEHYREAEHLVASVEAHSRHDDAPVLAQLATTHAILALAAATAMSHRTDGTGMHRVDFEAWDKAAGVPLDGSTPASPAAKPVTVYRAEHDSIVMGLYTTAAEARKHCEAEERRSWSTGTALAFVWIEDDEDGVAELVATLDGDPERPTGYVVTALEIASEYDPEADA